MYVHLLKIAHDLFIYVRFVITHGFKNGRQNFWGGVENFLVYVTAFLELVWSYVASYFRLLLKNSHLQYLMLKMGLFICFLFRRTFLLFVNFI